MRKGGGEQGFTLVEVMMAAVLASVVVAGASMLLIGAWRTQTRFMQAESTMQELAILESVLRNAARHRVIYDTGANRLEFYATNCPYVTNRPPAEITYDATRDCIIYDPDTTTFGDEIAILEGAIVSGFDVKITNGVVSLQVDIVERELERQPTNTFAFAVYPRNKVEQR
jgi:prepilin-type N-terminal cleavage/methylation domain-containing protein